MKKIELKDVVDIAEYERRRNSFRPVIMDIKNKRRIHVGPKITYLFETFDTMLYQVQEMTRAERIVDEIAIMQEINAYNELIPDKNQISASMLIEIDEIEERKQFLSKIIDLPSHTYLLINGEKVVPIFDPRQGTEDKLSSVQYLRFQLNDTQVSLMADPESRIVFGFDHLLYTFEYTLTPAQKEIVYQDLIAD